MKVLLFHIGRDRYGLPLASIVRVLPLLELKQLPLTPDYVAGLMDLHGVPVPVIDLSRLAGLLSHGQKQWLEIGMLLVQEPKLLLLDEPVAGMTDEETVRTAELFLSLKGKHSLMVVEHDMSFIDTISEKVTVLCDGSVLAEGTLAEVQADERVIEVYLGR